MGVMVEVLGYLKGSVTDGRTDGLVKGWGDVRKGDPVYVPDCHGDVILLVVNEMHFGHHYKGASILKGASYTIM